MFHTVSSFASRAYNALPTIKLDNPKNIIHKATFVAIPAIVLYGAAVAQGADAFLSCIACVVCLAAPNPGCVIPCVICGVLAPIPLHIAGPTTDQCQQKC